MSGRVVMVEAYSGRGGPPKTLLTLAPEMNRRRPTAVLIPPGDISDALQRTDVTVTSLPPWSRRRLRHAVASFGTLDRAVRAAMVDDGIVHLNGKSAVNLAASAVIKAGGRDAVVVHFHDSALTESAKRNLRLWVRLGLHATYLPVSQLAADVVRSAGVTVGEVVPNPISERSERAQMTGTPTVAFVGSGGPAKGLDRMIDVAVELQSEDVKWKVFGVDSTADSDFLTSCKQRLDQHSLANRVTWAGRVSDLPGQLAACTALLVASRKESFCRVAVEAMSVGLPVVAASLDGLVEAVGDAALQYDPRRPDAAASALLSILNSSQMFHEFQLRGVEQAAKFNPVVVCDLLEEQYARLGR